MSKLLPSNGGGGDDSGGNTFPQTLQELLHTEDAVALELQNTTGDILRLVSEFERKHAALIQRQAQLSGKSDKLRGRISHVESAVKRLTFPAHMSKLGEIIRDFVDENTDLGSDPVPPSELVRFVNNNSSSSSSREEAISCWSAASSSVGLPPMTREEQMQFQRLFGEGGLLESRGCGSVNDAFFRAAGRVPPQPHVLTKAENPDEVLLDLAAVPFLSKQASGGGGNDGDNNNNNNNNNNQFVLRRRSPLTDIAVMRCPAVGGRVLVSRRSYRPGQLLFAERPFLSVPRSTTALLPVLPPLLQRVVNEMLILPQAQTAMKHQGWDPHLINCVLVYLALQTYDAMARERQDPGRKSSGNSNAEEEGQGSWLWRAPAPLFRYTSGDFLGEDPAASRRMRKLLFLGAPLQAMEAPDVHKLHRLAQFVFAALPPCYRDFEGDDSACRSACLEWARRGVAASFDTLEMQQQEVGQHKPGSPEAAKAAAQQLHMTPYDDNPAHRQVAVSPLGREACIAADAATGGGGLSSAAAAAAGDAADQSALQLPPECRVSVSDIARIFAVFQTNCISLQDERSFLSSTADGIETAAARAFAASSKQQQKGGEEGGERATTVDASTAAAAQLSHPAPNSGLFTFMSLLEHSCTPNVVWCPASSTSSSASAAGCGASSELELRALRPIEPGERLRVAYIPPILPAAQRRQRLKHSFLFECGCEACTGLDWSRAVQVSVSTVSIPLSTTGDWADLSTTTTTASAAAAASDSGSSTCTLCTRGTGAAASRVRAENEGYSLGKSKKKQQREYYDDDGEDDDIDDLDEEEEEDDDDDNNEPSAAQQNIVSGSKMYKQPFKLVMQELPAVEKLFLPGSGSNDKMAVQPLHIAAYLHLVRLCAAWSYLLLACVQQQQQPSALYTEKVAPLMGRVGAVMRSALDCYVSAVLPGGDDASSSVAKIKIQQAVAKIYSSSSSAAVEGGDNENDGVSPPAAAVASLMRLPAAVQKTMLHSAVLPLLENAALNATLEQLLKTEVDKSAAAAGSNLLAGPSELWNGLATLVEGVLGWEKSPLASKYRLYCANPKQCLAAPMEQPL